LQPEPAARFTAHANRFDSIEKELSFRDNAMMLLGDAKKMTEEIVNAMSGAGH